MSFDRSEHDDHIMHSNLRRIGPLLDLPEPTDAQQAHWKQPPGAIIHGRHRSRKGLFFFLGSSSAIAATLAICVLAMVSISHTVSAEEIFSELRRAMASSVQLMLEDVEVDYSALDGVPITGRVLVNGHMFVANAQGSELYLDLDMSLNDVGAKGTNSTAMSGDFRVRASLAENREWMYLQAANATLPSQSAHPMRQLIHSMAAQGVYLKLEGLFLAPSDYAENRDAIAGMMNLELSRFRHPQQLSELVGLIETHARHITVQRQEDGKHILRAEGFYDGLVSADTHLSDNVRDFVSRWTRNALLEVTYTPGHGVEDLVVQNVGPSAGAIILSFDGTRFDPRVMDLAHARSMCPAPVFDLSQLVWLKNNAVELVSR